MPAKSKAQLRAMYAAAEGKSTLGISPKVGKEFVKATPKMASLPAKAPKQPHEMNPDEFHRYMTRSK